MDRNKDLCSVFREMITIKGGVGVEGSMVLFVKRGESLRFYTELSRF